MVQVSLNLEVKWFPDWIKNSKIAIIGQKTKEKLKDPNLLLLKNQTKSTVVRTVPIDHAIFSEIEDMTEFARLLEDGEYILLSRVMENLLLLGESHLITVEAPQMNVFTYGTFLSAFWDFTSAEPFLVFPGSRHHVLEEYHFLRAKLDGFTRIWPPGLSFPFIAPQAGVVLGEIYLDVPPNKFVELDRIEGEGYLYNRESISVELLDAPFKGLTVDAVTYVGTDNLVSEYPKQPIFDRLIFGDVYYIEREETWQKHIAKEELFIKHVKGTIPILITTYSPVLEAQYRGNARQIFEISVDELCKLADEITKEIFLHNEKQLPYVLTETLQNIWSPEILDKYNEKKDLKGYIEMTCNSFIKKMQKFIKECVERFEECILLILKSHPQESTDLIVDTDLIDLTKNLKSTYKLTYSTDKDKIIEDLMTTSNIEKIAVIEIKIQEDILLNPFRRENLAAELAATFL
ncbi:MAG: gamma-glutamylcyclotransferase [Promethearchaeota archaeon]